jgi:hypothetical protein
MNSHEAWLGNSSPEIVWQLSARSPGQAFMGGVHRVVGDPIHTYRPLTSDHEPAACNLIPTTTQASGKSIGMNCLRPFDVRWNGLMCFGLAHPDLRFQPEPLSRTQSLPGRADFTSETVVP